MEDRPPEKKRVKLSLKSRKEKNNALYCDTSTVDPEKITENRSSVTSCIIQPVGCNLAIASRPNTQEKLQVSEIKIEQQSNLLVGDYKEFSWDNWKPFPGIPLDPLSERMPANLKASTSNVRKMVTISEEISFEWTPFQNLCQKCFCRRSVPKLAASCLSNAKARTDMKILSPVQSSFCSFASPPSGVVVTTSSNNCMSGTSDHVSAKRSADIVKKSLIKPLFKKSTSSSESLLGNNAPILSTSCMSAENRIPFASEIIDASFVRPNTSFVSQNITKGNISPNTKVRSNHSYIWSADIDSIPSTKAFSTNSVISTSTISRPAGIVGLTLVCNSATGTKNSLSTSTSVTAVCSVTPKSHNSSSVSSKTISVMARPSSSNVETVKKCPLCSVIFDPRISQVERDGHIAACLQATSYDDDIAW